MTIITSIARDVFTLYYAFCGISPQTLWTFDDLCGVCVLSYHREPGQHSCFVQVQVTVNDHQNQSIHKGVVLR